MGGDSRSVELLRALVGTYGGLITTEQARSGGLTKSALHWLKAKGRLHQLRVGVLTSTEVWSSADLSQRHRLLVRAHQLVNPESVACSLSAATILGLPTPDGAPAVPRLTVPRRVPGPGGGGRRAGVLSRRSWLGSAEIRQTRGGIRLTSPMRTVLDCARELDRPWGLAIADAAVDRFALDPTRLVDAAGARPPTRGISSVLWVAQHARSAVESPLESLARAAIMLSGAPEPQIQAWVQTDAGPFRVDLLDAAHRLVTEADGRLKYVTPDDLWREKRREDAIRRAGYGVMRFTMAEHHRPVTWLSAYHRALAAARPQP
jgi:very-short-patch-repair endonuclease